jgi:hypothetical protein
MGGFEAVQANHTRIAVTAERFTEEGFGGGNVTGATEVRLDRFALFINGRAL